MSERVWNEQQTAIFADAERGTGDTVVIARAGTGKTTTMLEACRRFPSGCSVVFLAFNTRIRDEVRRKAPDGVDVRTLHSLGRGALYVYSKQRGRQLAEEPTEHKTLKVIERRWPKLERDKASALAQAVSFGKNVLARTAEDFEGVVWRLDLDIGTRPDSPDYPEALDAFCRCAVEVMGLEVQAWERRGEYDFDDMIWLPVRLGLRVKQYDRVIVDEGQDLNACQHELARKARRANGRIVMVGDPFQAIYSWRGAADDGMDQFRRDLGARVLRLPVTYRCGKAIVALAREVVPDYEAAPSNADGRVDTASIATMLRDVQPGDAIVSRVNAPLLRLCLALLVSGKRARIAGRDVGAALVKMIREAERGGADTIPELIAWVTAKRDAEIERVLARNPPGNPEPAAERAECMIALTEGLDTIAALKLRIDSLFSDDVTDADTITLTSTHKAKGLEWRTVWMLAETFRPMSGDEERNLWYVAATRAIDRLVLVTNRAQEPEQAAATPPASRSAVMYYDLIRRSAPCRS